MRRRCITCGRPGPYLRCWRCTDLHGFAGYLRLLIPGSTGWRP